MNWIRCVTSLLATTNCPARERTASSTAARSISKVVHMNHAGASPSSDAVLRRMIRHLEQEQILGGYAAKNEVQEEIDAVYDKAASLIRASSASEIAMVESATVAWTRLFYAFAAHQETFKKTDEKIILVSEAEYAANLVAACRWSQCHPGWSVLAIPSAKTEDGVTSTGKVDLECLNSILEGTYQVDGRTVDPRSIALACVTHVPTNSGIVNPAGEIGRQIAEFNESESGNSIFYLADTCQSIGQLDIHVKDMKCSGLVATGRKYLRGPRGSGFLYIPDQISSHVWPHHVDHYGIPVSSLRSASDIYKPLQDTLAFAPRRGASRFEFWESNIAGRLGLGQALEEVLEQGQADVAETILNLSRYLVSKLHNLNAVKLHHHSECGIVTMFVPGIESSLLARELHTLFDGVLYEVSVVPATSTPLDTAATGVPDLLRASVSYMTTHQDIDRFCERLAQIIATSATVNSGN